MEHILISTPPPSPTLWIAALAPPRELDVFRSEEPPIHKKQKRRTRPKKRKQTDPISEALPVVPVAECDSSDMTEAAHNPDSYPGPLENPFLDMGDIVFTDSDRSADKGDQLYMRYVDAVLADDAPFCQVSAEVFVVSGWDIQEGCNNVCQSEFLSSL